MKKLTILSLILLCVSCSPESTDTDNSNAGSLIKTFKKYASGGTVELETQYEYNSQGNISKLTQHSFYGSNVIITFNYDSNGNMTSFEEVSTNPFDDVTTEINYITYEDDLIVKICQNITHPDSESSFDYPEVDKIEFGYDAFKNVNLFTHFYPEDTEFSSCDDISSIDSNENLVYDSSGNMIRYKNSTYFFSSTYLEYSYNNTHHPYANVKPAAYKKLYGFSTVNNISEAKEYDSETDELTGTISFKYEYNSENYPTKLTRTYSSDGASQSIVYEYEYY